MHKVSLSHQTTARWRVLRHLSDASQHQGEREPWEVASSGVRYGHQSTPLRLLARLTARLRIVTSGLIVDSHAAIVLRLLFLAWTQNKRPQCCRLFWIWNFNMAIPLTGISSLVQFRLAAFILVGRNLAQLI